MHYYKLFKLCKFPWMLSLIDNSDKTNKLLEKKENALTFLRIVAFFH